MNSEREFENETSSLSENEEKTEKFDMELQFALKKKDGEKLSYQCNLCKPKNSVISANVKSRTNLKRHLSNLH